MARNFLLLVSLGQLLFGGDIFWFSYKIVTANSIVVFEEKNIAPVMIPTKGVLQKLCDVKLKHLPPTPLEHFLNLHFDTLLPCFYSHASHIHSWNDKRTKHSSDRVEVVIEPIRFTVEFKDEFATINTFR